MFNIFKITSKNIFPLIIFAVLPLLSSCGIFNKAYNNLGYESYSGMYIFPDQLDKIKLGLSKKAINDILGTPTLTGTFDSKVWYYVYQKTKYFAVFKEHLLTQNVLILSFNDKDILIAKDFKTLKNMHKIPYDNFETKSIYKKSKLEPDLFTLNK